MNEIFRKYASGVAERVGSPGAFLSALALILVWATSGPLFHFSDTWQLVINTGTTIITFLMVFLIQNTQNRDAKSIHLKLDELIRAIDSAHNTMIDLEHLSDKELEDLHRQFLEMATQHEAPPEAVADSAPAASSRQGQIRMTHKAAHAVVKELKKRRGMPS